MSKLISLNGMNLTKVVSMVPFRLRGMEMLEGVFVDSIEVEKGNPD